MAELEQEIQNVKERLRAIQQAKQEEQALKEELDALLKRKEHRELVVEQFEICRQESVEIIQQIDDRSEFNPSPSDDTFALLFLGACSGQWAAWTPYQGRLPGFGGFLIKANGKFILIDPGYGTFEELCKEGIHPRLLDAVIVTHSHWDATHDLSIILRAARIASKKNRGRIKQQLQKRNILWKQLRLVADSSVLCGIPYDEQAVCKYIRNDPLFSKEEQESMTKQLSKFPYISPGKVDIADLLIGLNERFEELTIDAHDPDFLPQIELYTHKSYHHLSFGLRDCIPALDFIIKQQTAPDIRCVYLADTAYRKDIASFYTKLKPFKPIDVLICNVQGLRVQEDFTKATKHLGWDGLIQLTRDFIDAKLLTESSHVILRDWGLETVTKLETITKTDSKSQVLVAAPGKLHVYKEMYKKETGHKHVLIPGITWVNVSADDQGKNIFTYEHKVRLFYLPGESQQFGNLVYSSEAMKDVIRKALAATDDLTINVLITGETGTGKDELANAIHQEAKIRKKRQGNIVQINSLDPLFETDAVGVKGYTYTGVKARTGLYEEAKDGTFVIQEIGGMPLDRQKLLLTILQDRAYRPSGGNKRQGIHAQFIFTTDKNLHQACLEGSFVAPLLERMHWPIHIPPLRERPEDIPIILYEWRRRDFRCLSQMPLLSQKQLEVLRKYAWPGNVRELERVIVQLTMQGDWNAEAFTKIVQQSSRQIEGSSILDDSPGHSDELDQEENAILRVLKEANADMSKSEIQEKITIEEKLTIKKSTMQKRLNHLIKLRVLKMRFKGPKTRYQLLNRD